MNSNALTYKELSTILAALRVFQRVRATGGKLPLTDPTRYTSEETIDKMEHFEDAEPLTDEQINDLCERLNCPRTEDWEHDLLDLIEYAQDNLNNAKRSVGDEGCVVLEGLIGAQQRIAQAIEHYFKGEDGEP